MLEYKHKTKNTDRNGRTKNLNKRIHKQKGGESSHFQSVLISPTCPYRKQSKAGGSS